MINDLLPLISFDTFSKIMPNTKCDFLLVLIWPIEEMRVVWDKTCPGYELSWVRVVMMTSLIILNVSILPKKNIILLMILRI